MRFAPGELVGSLVRLTPTTEADAPALRATHASPEVAAFWDQPEPGFPMHDEPSTIRFTIRVEEKIVGLVQFSEELEPKYREAQVDVFVAGRYHGRGVGTEAVSLVVDHLIDDRGHHRVAIDPAAHNAAAIATYRKVGFQPVGIRRRAERDSDGRGWHDVLLMELVAEPGEQRRRKRRRPPGSERMSEPVTPTTEPTITSVATSRPRGERPR